MSATKYIFVTGGVVSSLGKGITAASLGRLLKARGLKVPVQKFDPYINVDPGTMSPFQHGEVFVTDDGAETDLDLGHYERFIDENLVARRATSHAGAHLPDASSSKERRGDYLGATVQVIPHITNEIKARIRRVAEATDTDVVITEVGGTVGDIESLPFLEAIRQFRQDVGRENVALHPRHARAVHRRGRRAEDQADAALRARAARHRHPARRHRLPLDRAAVAGHPRQDRALLRRRPRARSSRRSTSADVYQVPLLAPGAGPRRARLRASSGSTSPEPDLGEWDALVERASTAARRAGRDRARRQVRASSTTPTSRCTRRSSTPASRNGCDVHIRWVDAEDMTLEEAATELAGVDGVLVPGGFGSRGIEGKILAAASRASDGIPYLGICLGMQSPSPSSRATSAAWTAPTRPSSTPRRRTR